MERRLDPEAFHYHGEYSPSKRVQLLLRRGLHFTLYRLCYKNSDDYNSGGLYDNDNHIYATKVTITQNLTISIANTVAASVNLGSWGPVVCGSLCSGMSYPSFRASGSHCVGPQGDLNVYSLAFGGQGSSPGCVDSGSSDGSVMACEE